MLAWVQTLESGTRFNIRPFQIGVGDTEIWWSEILRTSPQPLLEPCKTPIGPSGLHIAHKLVVRLR